MFLFVSSLARRAAPIVCCLSFTVACLIFLVLVLSLSCCLVGSAVCLYCKLCHGDCWTEENAFSLDGKSFKLMAGSEW